MATTSIRSNIETQGAALAVSTRAAEAGADCDAESDSAELVARIARAASWHLRELSALPRTATDHFEARLARVPIDS